MQNTFLIIAIVVALGAGAYFFMGNGSPTDSTDTMRTTDTMNTMTGNDNDMPAMNETDADVGMDIVDTAVANEDFNTLVTAVSAAGLVDTLKSEGPFTVFAPTDAAFAALPAGTIESLLQPDSVADLTSILTYHVVPGAVLSGDLSDGMVVETVNGETITIGVSEAGVTVNGAMVVMADIETSNGVIHVIDTVLLP